MTFSVSADSPRAVADRPRSETLLANNQGVGQEQPLQAWGEGQLYQVYTSRGTFELRWRANEPGRFRQSEFLVFESQRPIDLRRDATGANQWPFGDSSSPLRRALERVLEQSNAPSNRIEVPAPEGTPMSDNPLVRFYRGAGGAIRGLTGDTVEFLARIAPYIPSGNGMVMPMALTEQQARGLAQTRELEQQTSQQAGDTVARFNDTLGFAMGLPPDSPEVQFGRIAIGVAEGVEGLVGIGRGALALVRNGDNLGLVVKNAEILRRFADPNTQQLGSIARWADGLTPEQYGALPTELRSSLRQGLARNADDAAAAAALRRLDQLDQGVPGASSSASSSRPRGTDTPRIDAATAPPPDAALARTNQQLEVVANYTRQIANPIVRDNVSALARQAIAAGDNLDLNRLAQIQQQVETSLALNTRRSLAGSVFSDADLQAALRQRLADTAGTDPGRNAALAASPQWLQTQAQDIALDRLDAGLFNGSGVPPAVRNQWRALAQSWAQGALPENPALALEALLSRPASQAALLREVAIDRIAGFDNASLGTIARSNPDGARELAELRQRVAGALDADFGDASRLKNLLGAGGDRSRARLLRDAVAVQLGGDSPLAVAVQRHAINQGTGERALVDLVTSPQASVNFSKEALISETLRAPGQKLTTAERALLRSGIDARLAEMGNDAARLQYLKDLSNSGQTLTRLTTPAAPVARTTPAAPTTPTAPAIPSASTRAPDPVAPDPAEPAPRPTPANTTPNAAAETPLARGVFQRGNQIVLRSSSDLEVALPPGWRFGPIEEFANLGGVGSRYTTISGHGALYPNELKKIGAPTLVTVPEGTRVVVLTPPGGVLGSRLGEYIDNRTFTVNYGIDTPNVVPIRVPYRVLEAGQTLPNAFVTPPNGLNVPSRGDVITVSSEEQARALSQMLKPNMGTVVINICAPVVGAPRTRWSGLQFEEFGVVNPYSLKRAHYGLPAATDAPPPTDLRSRSPTAPAPDEEPVPPLDTSNWGLNMGQSVFGRVPADPNPLPMPIGLGRPSTNRPAAPLVMTDPISGAPLRLGAGGQIEAVSPNGPTNITARQLAPDELTLPQLEQLGRAGFQRTGFRLSIKLGDYSVLVDTWGQRDPSQVINLGEVWGDLARSGQPLPTSSADLAERVAQTLAQRAPPGWGWAVKAAGPNPTVGSNTAGVNLGNYIEIGNLQSAVNSGAVLYDPSAPLGSRYRLNTVTNAAGELTMAVPLELTLGWRSAVAPTSLPGVPPLPVGVNFSRSSEIKTPLSGAINPELLQALNAGLNNPLGVQIWHDAGTLDVRNVRQINFALPGMAAREGAYTLPAGWGRLEDQLLTAEQRNDPNAWSTFTKATGTVGGSLFGIGGRAGFSTERVERLATDYRPMISQTFDQPAAAGRLARPSEVTSFTFIAGRQASDGTYRLDEVLPDNAAMQRQQGQAVQGDVEGRLIVPGRNTVEMPGSVLNALNGHVLSASDAPRIVAFLRSIDPAGNSGQANSQAVFDVLSRVQDGRPLDAEGITLIREAIRRYAEPASP